VPSTRLGVKNLFALCLIAQLGFDRLQPIERFVLGVQSGGDCFGLMGSINCFPIALQVYEKVQPKYKCYLFIKK